MIEIKNSTVQIIKTYGYGCGNSTGTGTSVTILTHFNYQMISDICTRFFEVDNLYADNLE